MKRSSQVPLSCRAHAFFKFLHHGHTMKYRETFLHISQIGCGCIVRGCFPLVTFICLASGKRGRGQSNPWTMIGYERLPVAALQRPCSYSLYAPLCWIRSTAIIHSLAAKWASTYETIFILQELSPLHFVVGVTVTNANFFTTRNIPRCINM
jgi:hypothetical protein